MRTVVSVFVAATMAAVSLLPPSHIHLRGDDHDHGTVEHSHWSPHAAPSRTSIDDDDGMLDVGFGVFLDHRDHPRAALLVKDRVPICPTRRAGIEIRHDHVPPKVAIFEIIAGDGHGLGISDLVGVADFRHPQGQVSITLV